VDDATSMGPISYLIVEFPGGKATGEGLAALVDLVDRGVVRVLDLRFIARDVDDTIRAIALTDLDNDGQLDLAVFEGAASGLLDKDDLDAAGAVLEKGSAAGILLFENVWAIPFVSALRRNGAQLVAAGYVSQDDLLATLDRAEG
jgi:Family of unknown function (DUF6325)